MSGNIDASASECRRYFYVPVKVCVARFSVNTNNRIMKIKRLEKQFSAAA
jgi:hypothetical protein